MKHLFLFLTIFLQLHCINAALVDSKKEYVTIKADSFEGFFVALKEKNVAKLMAIKANTPIWDKHNLTGNLISVYSGEKSKIPTDLTTNSDDEALLHLLIQGYEVLNDASQDKLVAYRNFSDAIQLSNDEGLQEGLKFSLISMLNLLKSEIFLNEEKFMPYLNHFKEIKSDVADDLIIALLEVSLKSKENSDFKSVAEKEDAMERVDHLFSSVSEDNLLKGEYYYAKAIQAKLNSNFIEALDYMHRGNKLFDNDFQRALYATTIWQLSSIHFLEKEMDSALIYLDKSRSISTEPRDNYYDERLASWIYSELGKYDSAYFYLDKSIKSEYKWDAKKNSLESSLLSVENQTEKLKLEKLQLDNRRKTNQNYLILAGALLFIGGLTALFLQKNTTKKRKLAEQETQIEQQKVETLLKEQELTSIDAMIAGQEKERTKVANELHDDLGSLMATVKLHFDNVKVDQKDPALMNAQKLLDEAYQKIRSMAHAKNSGVMANQGLLPAVKKMAKTINETNALKVIVEDFGLGERMENSLELTIFRIIQELIANIIKHSKANTATIQFTQHEDRLNIIVEDNGEGFDMAATKRSQNGMGLGTIEKRIEHLEGTFTVDSIIGKGTSILIDIPV